MLIINMEEKIRNKARNYYILGKMAENLNMNSEAASNYFKSLFAIDDASIIEKLGQKPKDHNERFFLMKRHIIKLYTITDRLFSLYRRTYTQELEKGEVELVRKRLMDAFEYARLEPPADEEIKRKFEELLKRGKAVG